MTEINQVAIYARVSSERLAESHTIESQVAALVERVAAARPFDRMTKPRCRAVTNIEWRCARSERAGNWSGGARSHIRGATRTIFPRAFTATGAGLTTRQMGIIVVETTTL
jgi:hypothetical protein